MTRTNYVACLFASEQNVGLDVVLFPVVWV